MELSMTCQDQEHEQACYKALLEEIQSFRTAEIQVGARSHERDGLGGVPKGDPVTIASIIITAIGAGGALTAALGKEGFLTRLAGALEAYIKRNVEISLTDSTGRALRLSGSAREIERIIARAAESERTRL